MTRTAILEDDPDVGRILQMLLEGAGHACLWYRDGSSLLREVGRRTFDLYVLDWNVPHVPGIEVTRRLRAGPDPTAPILMVTARDTEADIVSGLEAGADDYLVKPLRRAEFIARIEALLRRSSPPGEAECVTQGPYHFDGKAIHVEADVADLTMKEVELAVLFLRSPGRLFSRDHLEGAVWGREADVESRTLDTHVSRLRRKLELARHGWRISSVYGFGYRFEPAAASQAAR